MHFSPLSSILSDVFGRKGRARKIEQLVLNFFPLPFSRLASITKMLDDLLRIPFCRRARALSLRVRMTTSIVVVVAALPGITVAVADVGDFVTLPLWRRRLGSLVSDAHESPVSIEGIRGSLCLSLTHSAKRRNAVEMPAAATTGVVFCCFFFYYSGVSNFDSILF